MTSKQAIKLAVKALEKMRQLHAFNANLYKKGLKSERTEKDYREYEKICQAIQLLENMASH